MLEEIESAISQKLNLSQSHPSINKTEILKKIKRTIASIQRGLNKQKSQHPELLENDPLQDKITALFDGKVGAAFSSNRLDEIYKAAEERYKRRIPPGYKDEKKDGNEKYGDVIIWFQMIEKAKESKKPMIFITDDNKEDWWLWAKEIRRKIGPRAELIEEMFKNANQAFYMYGVERFMEYSRVFLKRKVDEKAIKEVRAVRKERDNILEEMLSGVGADEVVKSIAMRKHALENVLASPGRSLKDFLGTPANLKLSDFYGSTPSQKMADAIASSCSTNLKLSDVFGSSPSQHIAEMIASSAGQKVAGAYTSTGTQALAEIFASSTSQKFAESIASQVIDSLRVNKITDSFTVDEEPHEDKDQRGEK